MEKQFDIQVEDITPTIAQQILDKNINRPCGLSTVIEYAKEMTAGRWLLTHQGIAISDEGVLLDGQHRLRAIVMSGVTVKMCVFREVPRKAQVAMDVHRKRSTADSISLDTQVKISKQQVAIIRVAIGDTNAGTSRKSVQELSALVGAFTLPLEFIDVLTASNKQRGITSAPVLGAIVLAWFYVDDLDRLEQFMQILLGNSLPEGEEDRAAVTLRDWLMRSGTKTAVMRVEAFKKTQRAIVGFMARTPLTKLYGTEVYYRWPLDNPRRT